MKALVNPLLLLACIVLLAVDAALPAGGSAQVEGCLLALCTLGFTANIALGLARALSARPALALIGWAVAFLVFGGASWMLVTDEGGSSVSAQERIALRQRMKDWRAGGDPYAQDAEGDSLLLLAAGLGREKIVSRLIEAEAGALQKHAPHYAAAAHRAAERNRDKVLRLLVAAGLPVDVRLGESTPLHAAALGGARLSAACLLELGAPVNAPGADGSTPLHHAVLAEDLRMVRLLVAHGADASQPDADGVGAAGYARTEEMEEALAGKGAAPTE